jgi:hypothetical protein
METQQNDPATSVTAQPVTPVADNTVAKSNRKRTILALWLMIGPTALIIVSVLGFALVNYITAQTAPEAGALFSEPSAGPSAMNIILFIVGAVSVMAWLPGLIIGIILLATKKK